jgi:uncharacterized protein
MKDLYEAAHYAMQNVTPVSRRSSDHGVRHWHDVARIGYMLLEVATKGLDADENHYDPALVFLFAALHDTQRENEYDDPHHGSRASLVMTGMVTEGIVDLSDDQFNTLDEALNDHDRGRTTDDPTVSICWDADRLTLPRVGIKPKKTLMSSAPVKHDFDMCLGFATFILQDRDLSWSEIAKLYEERFYGHAPA